MKLTSSIFASMLVLGLTTEVQAAALGNVWLLGDSVTQGRGFDADTNIANEWGYRYELWKTLNTNGDTFDFVSAGTPTSNGFDEDNRYYGPSGATLPEPGFDRDHEGRAGWSTSDVLNNGDSSNGNINHWLGTTPVTGFTSVTPDTTFIFLGLNDIISTNDGGGNAHGTATDIVNRLNSIVSKVDAADGANGQIFVGTLYDYDFAEYSQFSSQRSAADQEALVDGVNALLNDGTTLNTTATLVDLTTGFDWNTFTNDGLHPGDVGAQFVASKFYDAATASGPTAVPVPAAVWLFGSALLGLIGTRRKT